MSNAFSPEKKALTRVFTWTATIVVMLTTINALFIVNSVGPGIEIPFTRNVASIPVAEEATEEFISPIIEFDCQQNIEDMSITTLAPTTRVSFKHCKNIGRILNESNHNQGDLFLLPGKVWTSDFIFLSPGTNTLKIPTKDKIYTIEIIRELIKKEADKKAL